MSDQNQEYQTTMINRRIEEAVLEARADERAKCQEAIKVLAEALQRVSGLPCIVSNDQNDICGVTHTCANCQLSLVALTALSNPAVQAVFNRE